MILFKIVIFLAFSLSLSVFPYLLYHNRYFRKVRLGMAYCENFRLFTARVLCLFLILYHLAYYAIDPTNKGIMISTVYAFFSLAAKKNMVLLQAIRRSRTAFVILAIMAIVFAFVLHMPSVTITIAYTLVAAACFPYKVKHRKSKTTNVHVANADADETENLSHS